MFTFEELSGWISDLKKAAAEGKEFNVSFFTGTRDAEACIIGGWKSTFAPDYDDLLFINVVDPTKALCLSIVMNPGSEDVFDRDFDSFSLPICDSVEEDTTVVIEREDDPDEAASFYFCEWERISKTLCNKAA